MKSNSKDKPLIDTSQMSPGERAALEMAEAAREQTAENRLSYGASLFMGRPENRHLTPFPKQSLEDRDQGDAFLQRLEPFLDQMVDADQIDEEGEIPQDVIDGLATLGAFGIKIPIKYGGLGLSQTNYARAAMALGGVCGNLTALVSAHQSIGVPQPLILFGTEAQKREYLPRVARGEISAFALTEPDVGSDPAKMRTSAEPADDGETYVINGEKLWCTNGTKAGVIVVMARTPSITVRGRERPQVTAFIVDMATPGITVKQRCHFMGLRSLYNAVITFEDVRVPAKNVILGPGKGLKVALTTLNTGRITLPAACTGLANACLKASTAWAGRRVQWGAPIGHHGAIGEKLARMAAHALAMEAMTYAVSGMVDRDKQADIRIEAAMAKLWGTERAWEIVDATMQIRGGRGYETAQSQKLRGEEPVPVERWLRDCRINTIFEGSSEIMRLFIAREALDPHLKIGADVVNGTLPIATRLRAAVRAALFYARWYPRRWMPNLGPSLKDIHPSLRHHMHRTDKQSRRLSRSLFHAMLRHGPKLDKQQALLGRFVDIGTEIFAVAATMSYVSTKLSEEKEAARRDHLIEVADYFGKCAALRIRRLFDETRHHTDKDASRLSRKMVDHPLSPPLPSTKETDQHLIPNGG